MHESKKLKIRRAGNAEQDETVNGMDGGGSDYESGDVGDLPVADAPAASPESSEEPSRTSSSAVPRGDALLHTALDLRPET